jgi:hypothetical protein
MRFVPLTNTLKQAHTRGLKKPKAKDYDHSH